MIPIPDQLRRKAEDALHKAALAMQANDIETKRQHLEEAGFWLRLLKDSGEEFERDIPEQCSETEDFFA